MATQDTDRTVPAGALLTALEIVKMLGHQGDGPSPDSVELLEQGHQHWGTDTVTEALSTIIYAAVNSIPAGDEGDALTIAGPAIIRRFRSMQLAEVPDAYLPTVAGILTAAYLGQNAYEWRTTLSPIGNEEALAWCYVAWLVVDFVDDCVYGRRGMFAETLGRTLLDGPAEADAD